MADTLYPAGAPLMESGAASARQVGQEKVEREKIASENARSTTSEVGQDLRQVQSQQAAVDLEKLKASDKMQGKMMTITPQIALGLSRNTGDPGWLQAIGQDIRSDVLL